LQGQLSSDINKIVDGQWQLNAYCQHQGRIIALMWVQKQNDDFYLDFALNLKMCGYRLYAVYSIVFQ
jgi:folate-binding Fe-S cluster repair protein YgfZ